MWVQRTLKAVIGTTPAASVPLLLACGVQRTGREDATHRPRRRSQRRRRQRTARTVSPAASTGPNIAPVDLYHLRSVGDVVLLARRRAARVDGAAHRSARRAVLADLDGGRRREDRRRRLRTASRGRRRAGRLTASASRSSGATREGKSGVVVANADGTGVEPLADVMGSNHPLPQVGERLAWSPDGRRIAFVSATPGPEPDMEADPIVITRYWFRPASSAGGRFSDNRRLHLFVVDVASEAGAAAHRAAPAPSTRSTGRPTASSSSTCRIVSPIRTSSSTTTSSCVDVDSGVERRLTTTKNNEYAPVWSPDGQTIAYSGLERPITSSETNMEDTHVWTHRRRVRPAPRAGRRHRQPSGPAAVVPRRRSVYFTVQSRGSVKLHRLPAGGGAVELVAPDANARAQVGSFAVGKDGLGRLRADDAGGTGGARS